MGCDGIAAGIAAMLTATETLHWRLAEQTLVCRGNSWILESRTSAYSAKHSKAGFKDEIPLNIPVELRGPGAGGLEECFLCCAVACNQKRKKPLQQC